MFYYSKFTFFVSDTFLYRYYAGRRERGRGNGNTSSVPIRDAGFAGGKTFLRSIQTGRDLETRREFSVFNDI